MSHAVNLLNPSEEIILLEQLELLKQQHAEFQPEVERVYVKLLLRKKLRDSGLPVFNIDCKIEEYIRKTKRRDQQVVIN